MTQTAIYDTFIDALLALPRNIQHKTKILLRKLQRNPNAPGLNLERIQDTKNLYSVRVDRGYRGVLGQVPTATAPSCSSTWTAMTTPMPGRSGTGPGSIRISGIFEVIPFSSQSTATTGKRDPGREADDGLFCRVERPQSAQAQHPG